VVQHHEKFCQCVQATHSHHTQLKMKSHHTSRAAVAHGGGGGGGDVATAAVVASQTHHTVQEEESRGRTNHVVSIAGCQGAKKLRRESLSVQEKRLRVSGATQGRGARDDAPQ